MKTTILLFLLFAAFAASAQPGDIELHFTDPCGMPPTDTLDLSGDGIPDLIVHGRSVGTEDEPSSSGSCMRSIRTLPGTSLLCSLGRNGDRSPHAFAFGDTLPEFDKGIPNDMQIPHFLFTDGSIDVLQWGYGNQVRTVGSTPGLSGQVFVLQTTIPQKPRTWTITLEPLTEQRSVRIKAIELIPTVGPWVIR